MIYLEPLGPVPKWLFFGVAALFFPFLQSQNAHFLSMFQRFSFNVHAALKTRRVEDSGACGVYLSSVIIFSWPCGASHLSKAYIKLLSSKLEELIACFFPHWREASAPQKSN